MPETAFPVAEHAPAKINLALHITGKRPDGYHLLESLVVFTHFDDRLTATPAPQDSFDISGPFSDGLSADQDNLVIRARDAFRSRHSTCPPVHLMLQKNLPLASGIGGGSSDAAATLRALSRLTGTSTQLGEIALSLGADVPMCLSAKPLIAKGIGDVIEPVAHMPTMAMVLVNSGAHVATPAVFRALTRSDNPSLPPLPASVTFSTLTEWLHTSRNDLQPPAQALEPTIGEALSALESTAPAFSRMSGSGATCFALYETMADAEQAAASIRATRPAWFVAATATME